MNDGDTARPAHEPDANGLVHLLISGKPEAVAAVLGLIRESRLTGIVGSYTLHPVEIVSRLEKHHERR